MPSDPATQPQAARALHPAILIHALEQSGWVQAKAARLLDLTPRQIGYAIRKHGIAVKRF